MAKSHYPVALQARSPNWLNPLKPPMRIVARFLEGKKHRTVHPVQNQRATNLLQQLSEAFQAPLSLVERYVHNNFGQAPDLPVDEWLAGLSEVQRLHVTYALSTNQRAKEVRDIVAQHRSAPIGRHLDIGFGYGGLLRVFSELGATASVGIEIDETLAEYSRLNTADVNATIYRASVEEFDFRELGKFDLITCTEVIEHVRNPPYLVKVISELLETGGTLFLRVPNGRSINFVRQDGHFLLFGICLLSRQEAKEFKWQTTSSPDDYEHMGEYFQRGYYANLLLAHHIDATILNSLPENCLSDVPAKASAAVSALHAWSASPGKVSALQQTLLLTAFADYMEQFWGNYGHVLRGAIDLSSFYLDYLQDFWTFIGVKR